MEHKNQAALEMYCYEVGKHLVCKKSTKRRLLSALCEELIDTAQGCSSYEELTAQIGAPSETARNLQETVSDQEYADVLKKARRNRRVVIPAIVIVSLFLIAGMLIYVHHLRNVAPVYYTTEIREGPKDSPGLIWVD